MSKKPRKHHSKPHGGSVSYAQQLAQRRMIQAAIDSDVTEQKAAVMSNIATQRALWLMVVTLSEAAGWGKKRIQERFFPALQSNMDELRRMIAEDGETYAFEKLRLRAEEVSGIDIKHFYTPQPEAEGTSRTGGNTMGKHMIDPEVGIRAAREIRERCWKQHCTYTAELERLRLESTGLMQYERGRNPSAGMLQRMCLAGYDVVYILTGERRQ